MLKKYILPILLLLIQLHTEAQKTLVLSSPQTGQVNNFASDHVQFKPGYSFKASVNNWMRGYLDHKAINDITPLLSSSFTDLKDVEIGTNHEVGTIVGETYVDDFGSFNFNLNIGIPKNFVDLIPNLSILYNNKISDGILGNGWVLNGLSEISRTNNTIFHNNYSKGVDNLNSDAFVINGERLIPVIGNNGENGTTYYTKSETFQKITSLGNLNGSPNSFIVETKNGYTIEFGGSQDYMDIFSINNRTQFNNTPSKWLIKKITDLNGNQIQFNYVNNNKNKVISEIKYGIIGNNELFKIQFLYAKREKIYKKFHNGIEINHDILLEEIRSFSNNFVYKSYKFKYLYNNHYLLSEINEVGTDSKMYNSTKFNYGKRNLILSKKIEVNGLQFNNNLTRITQANDFDGDGISDIFNLYYDQVQNKIIKIEIFKGNKDGNFTLLEEITAYFGLSVPVFSVAWVPLKR